MAYIITRLCIRAGDCVEVCPVDCIVPGPAGDSAWPIFYIDPNTCIDCGACVPECPADAIFPEPEVPPDYVAAGRREDFVNHLRPQLRFLRDYAGHALMILEQDRHEAELHADKDAAEIDTNRQFFETGPGYWAFDLEKERIPISTK